MKKDSSSELKMLEGHAYTIGREGHIRIDDPSLSRGHAEIRFVDGRIRLRDLGSTNGTFLIARNKLIEIEESFVTPDQRIALGCTHYTVKALLAMVGVFTSYSDETGLVIKLTDPEEDPETDETDLDEEVSQTISRLFN